MKAMKHKNIIAIFLVGLLTSCSSHDQTEERNKNSAEAFFRGVYGGDSSVVTEFGAEDIALSYPIFQTLFNSPVIEGQKEIENFIVRFSTKWKDQEITINEAIAEGNTVVLVWSFKARDAFYESGGPSDLGPNKSWGGITVYHFDEVGKIKSEFGEESEPGPYGRILTRESTN